MNEVADKGAKFAARNMSEEREISFPAGYDENASWALTNDSCEERFLLDNLMKKQNMFPSRIITQTPYPEGRQRKVAKPPRTEISLEQVIKAIERVKNTSPGEDGIKTAEYRSLEAATELYELLVRVWADKTVPHQWRSYSMIRRLPCLSSRWERTGLCKASTGTGPPPEMPLKTK